MQRHEELLHILADGRFHSGQDIAASLGCSRSAVWKRIQQLRAIPGLEVDSVSGRGYRLGRPLELLQHDLILQQLPAARRDRLHRLEVLGSVGSTNTLAMQHVPVAGRASAWFAEHQSAGRGRRGRTWISPYGRNIYFSLAWRFETPLARLSGLSIAAGTVLCEVLEAHGLRGHGLKWPNDLLWQGRKLAGILLEANGETEGPATAVIGIGVNLDLDHKAAQHIDQPHAALRDAGLRVQRNRLAADLLDACMSMCIEFADRGLQPFLDTWQRYDAFRDRPVRLVGPRSELHGHYLRIADDGGLRLLVEGREQTFYAGELSLRPGDPA
jgi:BirA family biotin operon repressor/biotin-[acetyl-CoA-carboxylase] ligase